MSIAPRLMGVTRIRSTTPARSDGPAPPSRATSHSAGSASRTPARASW